MVSGLWTGTSRGLLSETLNGRSSVGSPENILFLMDIDLPPSLGNRLFAIH
jgi:hypothetical protein